MKARICTSMMQMLGLGYAATCFICPQNVFNVARERGLPGHDRDRESVIFRCKHACSFSKKCAFCVKTLRIATTFLTS